jgi:hypothetical protein
VKRIRYRTYISYWRDNLHPTPSGSQNALARSLGGSGAPLTQIARVPLSGQRQSRRAFVLQKLKLTLLSRQKSYGHWAPEAPAPGAVGTESRAVGAQERGEDEDRRIILVVLGHATPQVSVVSSSFASSFLWPSPSLQILDEVCTGYVSAGQKRVPLPYNSYLDLTLQGRARRRRSPVDSLH